jgi:signal peptidase II
LRYVYGPLSLPGLIVAALSVAVDQASKLWLLYVYDLGSRGSVPLMPYFDLVLVENKGISYGLFPQEGLIGQLVLLGVKVIAVLLLWAWLAQSTSRLVAVSLGLIIGGAVGNAIDRIAHGAVVDFVFFHLTTASFQFNWYVFNLADVAIVAGVAGVLYDSLIRPVAVKAP